MDINNLQVLCDDCNRGKGSHDQTDWRPESQVIWDDSRSLIDLPLEE